MKRRTGILILVTVALLAAVAEELAVRADVPQSGDAHIRHAPLATTPDNWSGVCIDLLQNASLAEPLRSLGGIGEAVLVLGASQGQVQWQFGYEDTVVANGAVGLDDDGIGVLKLAIPHVRVRLECDLILTSSEDERTRAVVLYPATRLDMVRRQLSRVQLGVHDPRGLIQAYFTTEEIPFKDLSTMLQVKTFEGGLLIVASPDGLGELRTVCRAAHPYLDGGGTVILLNPMSGWSDWGLTTGWPSQEATGRVSLDESLGQVSLAADLGRGPWPTVLTGSEDVSPLAWVVSGEGADESDRAVLAAATSAGEGTVLAAVLPQLEDPLRNPMGRVMLDEIILWFLCERLAPDVPNEE